MNGGEERRRFLEGFPESLRGAIANFFYEQVRKGLTEPRAVCSALYQELKRRRAEYGFNPEGAAAALWKRLPEDREGALLLAAWTVEQEQLPPAVREQQKAAAAEAGRRAWMDQQAPTERQREVLNRLGHDGEIRSRLHASDLIEELKDW